jgi:hypothetical protein
VLGDGARLVVADAPECALVSNVHRGREGGEVGRSLRAGCCTGSSGAGDGGSSHERDDEGGADHHNRCRAAVACLAPTGHGSSYAVAQRLAAGKGKLAATGAHTVTHGSDLVSVTPDDPPMCAAAAIANASGSTMAMRAP